jgi:hypothetical protein
LVEPVDLSNSGIGKRRAINDRQWYGGVLRTLGFPLGCDDDLLELIPAAIYCCA